MQKQLTCPNDQSVLLQSSKNGIEIEYCSQCGGVWLDHGELEKLVSLSDQQPIFGPPDFSQSTSSNSKQHTSQQHKKKENWLGELFDF
jgi:uncharacterized protein